MSTSVAETATLVHGFTMADVDKAAGIAANLHRHSFISFDDRRETAWSAIVEYLYANAVLESRNLVEIGNAAIRQARNDEYRHGGVDREGEPARNAQRYWRAIAGGESHTDRVEERVALRQALGALPVEEYEALVALAALGTNRLAAGYLGINPATFSRRIQHARRTIWALWVAPETPHEWGWRDTEVCVNGHSRAESGYIGTSGKQRCRTCNRNNTRRGRARTA